MFKKLGLKLKEQKGFTLIELLAVIVILGIIAAIAIPAINSVIGKSENKAKVQEGIQIINAAKLYVADKKPGAGSITNAVLGDYLDKVKENGYTVTLAINATSGKYSYILTAHSAASVSGVNTDGVEGASEQELLNYVK